LVSFDQFLNKMLGFAIKFASVVFFPILGFPIFELEKSGVLACIHSSFQFRCVLGQSGFYLFSAWILIFLRLKFVSIM